MPHPSTIAYAFLGSFLASTFCLQWWQRTEYKPLLYACIAVAGACIVLAIAARKIRTHAALGAAAILGCTIAFLAVGHSTRATATDDIESYAAENVVSIAGFVADEPDRRPMQTKYTVETEELITASGARIPVHGRVLATDHGQWPEFAYGDAVVIRGILGQPGTFEEFRYDRYLSLQDIYAVMPRAGIAPAEGRNRGNPILRFLFAVKEQFEAQVNRLYPEPHASFMAGILTGSRRGIPDELLEDFNTVGLTHIVAISGYNITIVTAVVSGMLFWLPLKVRFLPAVAAIAGFALFVGASAAVVRAAVMGVLGLLALQLGRQYHVRLAVLWTAFLMLCWNPKSLWYDAGFQLSFLAVIGLTELSPLLQGWCARLPKTLGIREAMQMTCAAQLATLPLTAVLFGRVSLIAPAANLLAAPFVPLAMLFGFAGTLVSFVAFFPGQLIAYVGWGCLEWIVRSTELLARVPYASLNVPGIGWGTAIAYSMALIIATRLAPKRGTVRTSARSRGTRMRIAGCARAAPPPGRAVPA